MLVIKEKLREEVKPLDSYTLNINNYTTQSLRLALDAHPVGKAPGNDGIPSDVIKCAKGTLLHELHEILCLCWGEGKVPQDMRDGNIVTL